MTDWWGQKMAQFTNSLLPNNLLVPDALLLVHNSPKLDNVSCLVTDYIFAPNGLLGNQTICPMAKHLNGREHIKMHNEYGLGHAKVTQEWLTSMNVSHSTIISMTSSPGYSNLGVLAG